MWVSIGILILLWAVNLTPPLLAYALDGFWNTPLDRGMIWRDGKPLFGPHKTIRGILGAVAVGVVLAVLFMFPWWVGFLAAVLSMAGDLVSSFFKRRWGMQSGGLAPGLDQIFEGLFPFLVLTPYFSLSALQIAALTALFCMGAYVGSRFYKRILNMKPFDNYPRLVRSWVRLREWRACQLQSNPLGYLLNFERAFYYHFIMKTTFRILGIYERGKENALQVERNERTLYFPDLPESFDGYKILMMSDLHLDGLPGLTEKVRDLVKDIDVDLCILGGDYRMETFGPFRDGIRELMRIIPFVRARDGIYGILGNHDCPEMIGPLVRHGVNFLINDAVAVNGRSGGDGEKIWLLGVDDPHYYKCHDLAAAFEGVPLGAFTILAAHSPEIYREASDRKVNFYLCGHTHAGQIQLPRVGAVFTHCKGPRWLVEGMWRYNGMSGYTTSGVGVSGVPVRFYCKGEVAVITLRRGPSRIPERAVAGNGR